MIAVDTNILIYAHRKDAPWHGPALSSIARLAEGRTPWMIPWPCVHEFVSVVTRRSIFPHASSIQQAIVQVEDWMRSTSLVIGGESPQHWTTLKAVLNTSKVFGGAIHDARIAAICLDHEVTALWTADRDFSRFARLKVVNPLVGA